MSAFLSKLWGKITSRKPDRTNSGNAVLGINYKDVKIIFYFTILAVLSGLILVLKVGLGNSSIMLLWALGFMVSGIFVGFLFGIPRVPQNSGNTAANNAAGGITPQNQPLSAKASLQVNTNLEQISDWLTKIIVGVGLVECKKIPGALYDLSVYIVKSLDDTAKMQNPESYASALVLYFSVLGLFSGYIITRIYLASVFDRADSLIGKIWEQKNLINKLDKELKTEIADNSGIGKDNAATQIKENSSDKRQENSGSAENLLAADQIMNDSAEYDSTDIQKGKWGGQAEINDRKLSAKVYPYSKNYFQINLRVESTSPKNPLTGYVTFYLHQSFKKPFRQAIVVDGVASLVLYAYGAFTVGAVADSGMTKLELDLSQLPDAPQKFREN